MSILSLSIREAVTRPERGVCNGPTDRHSFVYVLLCIDGIYIACVLPGSGRTLFFVHILVTYILVRLISCARGFEFV